MILSLKKRFGIAPGEPVAGGDAADRSEIDQWMSFQYSFLRA